MISCTRCQAELPAEALATPDFVPCPTCRSELHVEVFPAALEALDLPRPQELLAAEEASCFFHARKRAQVPCATCGRFLCALCDLELDGEHLCPRCLERAAGDPSNPRLVRERTLYDSIALGLATLPLLFFYPTLVTAPATLFFVVYTWKRPRSLLPRSRVRFVIAFLLAGLQLAGWTLLFGALVANLMTRS